MLCPIFTASLAVRSSSLFVLLRILLFVLLRILHTLSYCGPQIWWLQRGPRKLRIFKLWDASLIYMFIKSSLRTLHRSFGLHWLSSALTHFFAAPPSLHCSGRDCHGRGRERRQHEVLQSSKTLCDLLLQLLKVARCCKLFLQLVHTATC